ncbi:MAG: hypothetical protein ABSG43_00325 [Solirubrobacteraceae bacterium]
MQFISTGRCLEVGVAGTPLDLPDGDLVAQRAVVGGGLAVLAPLGEPPPPDVQFMLAGVLVASAPGRVAVPATGILRVTAQIRACEGTRALLGRLRGLAGTRAEQPSWRRRALERVSGWGSSGHATARGADRRTGVCPPDAGTAWLRYPAPIRARHASAGGR